MNLRELLLIVEQIKKKVKCQKCHTGFSNKNIQVIGTHFNEALFHFSCPKCNSQMLINVVSGRDEKSFIHHPNTNSLSLKKKISHDDVLDIHNFLKNFKGDFTRYFNK